MMKILGSSGLKRAFASGGLVFGLLTALVAIVLFPAVFVNVPAGHVGVYWLRFFGGTVTTDHFGEGLKIIFPWNKIYLYDGRVRRSDATVEALTNDGLSVKLEMTILLMLNPDSVGEIHKYVGPDYLERVVVPFAASNLREIVSARPQIDLFTGDRHKIEMSVKDAIYARLSALGLPASSIFREMEVNLGAIDMPASVRTAIEAKLAAAQNAQRYQFVLESERQESQRKAIEAEGIKQFQSIVTPTISDSYLKWRGIEATLRLAESPNAKVVIIGSSPNGLPIILGNDSTAPATVPAPVEAPAVTAGR